MSEAENSFSVRNQIIWRSVLHMSFYILSFTSSLLYLADLKKMHKSICTLLAIQIRGMIHLFTEPNPSAAIQKFYMIKRW